jgi:uncharacterized cupredoxin-like copper-binding protein
MQLTRSARNLLGISLAAVAFAGCGGGGSNGGSSQNEATQTQPAQTPAAGASTVTGSEFKFQPSTVTAKKGGTVTFKNGGTIGHDLKLRKGSKEVGGINPIDPGKTAELKLNFAPGTYVMFCSVPGHEQAGMKGSFTIK